MEFSINLSNVRDSLMGLNLSNCLVVLKQTEDSVHAGRNAYMTCAMQISQTNISLSYLNILSEQLHRPPLPLWARSICYLTPVILAYVIDSRLIENETIYNAMTFTQHHLGTLCHVASLVSSVALTSLGSPYIGITSIVFLSLGALVRCGLLPHQVRSIISSYIAPLGMIAGFTNGFNLQFILNLTGLIGLIYTRYSQLFYDFFHIDTQVTEIDHALSYADLETIVAGQTQTEINPDYINYNTFPIAPDKNILQIIEMADAIDWSAHQGTLNRKLSQDQIFIKENLHPETVSDEAKIAYLKASLGDFIRSIASHQILEGEPLDYRRLTDYLKHIVNFLENEDDEITKTDAIMRLAIEGGRYCGPGKFEVAESVFTSFMQENADIDTRLKVLNCLQDFRKSLFESFFDMVQSSMQRIPHMSFIDWQDLHVRNLYRNMFSSGLGLRQAGAESDQASQITFIERVFYELYFRLIQPDNIRNCTEESLINHLMSKIGTPSLPKPEIFAWWSDWIERQDITPERKAELLEEIAHARLLGQSIEYTFKPHPFKPAFIQAMLVDMGILRLANPT